VDKTGDQNTSFNDYRFSSISKAEFELGKEDLGMQ